ncbi:MAG: ribulose-phosphate 3-epimerase [Thermacetogeniaceae bacterium]
MRIKIGPSILSADFANLASQIHQLEAGGADYLHLDVMDGRFVPNLTFGPVVVKALRRVTSLPFDVHLMVQEPERFIEQFKEAGADILTVHAEVCPHLHRVIRSIKHLGMKAGVALNPATPLHVLEYILEEVDLVLLMTVNPGWGGQEFIQQMCKKVEKMRKIIDNTGFKIELEVDGGINLSTVGSVVAAGAESLVIGSALFREVDLGEAVRKYRLAVEKVACVQEEGR